ncbi:hypothetical protein MUN76_07615 [Leucobacter rhizosphaerae]|uniref:Uncharacterized protein n=1 Tax=Leucobacter rhizosphaerae TaxID=2932245 RepID=A0ABY4FZT2_9MICO|nr:hypothetical protein [Leucobacter rhizosphaerae]UOQ61807.1 hypothetical protein MUN76_07615 [Leucobacter rhizosphaerae]
MAKMIREQWKIDREVFELDARGVGQARYVVTTPGGVITFLAFLREPSGKNRTGRIIGTSWDMVGTLLDGVATPEQIRSTEEELPRLYEGRATENTLVWFRSNQSLRLFRSVREALSRGEQPDAKELRRVGYVMRNTGLDGNGTFGSIPFAAIRPGHPLKTSYHAQMLAAYLMRELSVDVVEELARIDAPETAVRLDPSVKRLIGVGNGSALGLVMLFFNRPVLVNAYISAYLDVLGQVLADPELGSASDLEQLERHLDRTIRYRAFLPTSYRFFTSNMEMAADLRRIRAKVRAARRGEIVPRDGETVLATIHRLAAEQVSKDALHSFNALLLELAPELCDRAVEQCLDFDERLDLDPATPLAEVAQIITTRFRWALELPLNGDEFRDRVWYQSRAAEEPRSGPREEVPVAHELVQNYPVQVRALLAAVEAGDQDSAIGSLLAERPELEYITRLVLALQERPYALVHADPHDTDFVPVWVIRFVNAFVHGLDRTEDHLGRDVRGLIFEGAPYRDELADADASEWWWSYEAPVASARRAPSAGSSAPSAVSSASSASEDPVSAPAAASAPKVPLLTPIDSPITPPCEHATETIDMKYREIRLMAGRAYQALNLPEGSWHGAREFVVTALVADPRVVTSFGELLISSIHPDTALAAPWEAPADQIDGTSLVVDNRGQSLLLTGHVLVNLLGAHADDGERRFVVRNVREDHAMAGVQLELQRYGIDLALEPQDAASETITGTVRRARDPEAARALYRAATDAFMADGLTVSSSDFWNIYYRGNAGLDADSPISRQHTGGTVLDVIKPGERITKQFTSEELSLLTDPDELDNHRLSEFIDTH